MSSRVQPSSIPCLVVTSRSEVSVQALAHQATSASHRQPIDLDRWYWQGLLLALLFCKSSSSVVVSIVFSQDICQPFIGWAI